jgi:hypothetical protein
MNGQPKESKPTGPLRRAFTVMALENCDILTLPKSDLARMEAEFEEMVSEMFLNAHRKIRKLMRIKDESENAYIMRQVSQGQNVLLGADRTANLEVNEIGEKTWNTKFVRRMGTSLYSKHFCEELSPLPKDLIKDGNTGANITVVDEDSGKNVKDQPGSDSK